MGRIFFNPETGEFWERHLKQRTPPPGYVATEYKINWLNHKTYYTESYYCPTCRKYHYLVSIDSPLAKYKVEAAEIGKRFGCEAASLVLRLRSFKVADYVRIVFEKNRFDRWRNIILGEKDDCRLKNVLRVIAEGVEGGEDDNVIMAKLFLAEMDNVGD
ncbi:MAG: hypothetical protein QXY99_07020 [Thermoproteota archaeon]